MATKKTIVDRLRTAMRSVRRVRLDCGGSSLMLHGCTYDDAVLLWLAGFVPQINTVDRGWGSTRKWETYFALHGTGDFSGACVFTIDRAAVQHEIDALPEWQRRAVEPVATVSTPVSAPVAAPLPVAQPAAHEERTRFQMLEVD